MLSHRVQLCHFLFRSASRQVKYWINRLLKIWFPLQFCVSMQTTLSVATQPACFNKKLWWLFISHAAACHLQTTILWDKENQFELLKTNEVILEYFENHQAERSVVTKLKIMLLNLWLKFNKIVFYFYKTYHFAKASSLTMYPTLLLTPMLKIIYKIFARNPKQSLQDDLFTFSPFSVWSLPPFVIPLLLVISAFLPHCGPACVELPCVGERHPTPRILRTVTN